MLVASYIFYGWWDWHSLLPAASPSHRRQPDLRGRHQRGPLAPAKRAWCLVAVAANVAVLGYFKYYNFFVDWSTGSTSSASLAAVLQVILPIGISFFTFQAMSYVIDAYRGQPETGRAARLRRLPVVLPPPRGRSDRAGHRVPAPAAQRPADPRRDRGGARLPADRGRAVQEGGGVELLASTIVKGLRRPAPTARSRSSSPSTATPSRSTPTSAATPTSPSASRCCSASASRRTSTRRTSPSACRTSGGAGT